jgi:hypothetical protein
MMNMVTMLIFVKVMDGLTLKDVNTTWTVMDTNPR